MPSREEIVSCIREAANLTRDSQYEEIFEQRAAQVESMRCVECKKSKGASVNAVTFCNKFFVNFPHDHGCFAHEPKEKPAD